MFKEPSCVEKFKKKLIVFQSYITASRVASAALEALLMNFFQIFELKPISLCLRNLPVLKNSKNINCLSIVFTASRAALVAQEALLMNVFQIFRLKPTSL